jgi:NADH:ubiquinone oxidoreductase subunit 3 (subunit A)
MIEVILEVFIIGLLTLLAGIVLIVVNDIVGENRSTTHNR